MKPFDAYLIASATKVEQFPLVNLPEIAFAGRSNVGKSSLINSLLLRKEVARTSSKPGKTQQIFFYLVQDKFVFADMPGFGFARVAKTKREEWAKLNTEYLKSRGNLKLVCYLVDSRLEPQQIDISVLEMLENFSRKYVVILTKSDKLNKDQLMRRIKQFEFILQYCSNVVEILPYSSVTKIGREQLLAIIRKHIEF